MAIAKKPQTKSATKAKPVKKATAKSPAKKPVAKKPPAKKAPVKKAPVKKAPAKKSPAKRKAAKKRPVGRPTKYTPELSNVICGRIASGESLFRISKDAGMPSTVTMFAWMRKHEEFLNSYTIAKQECADVYAEEIIDIADDGTNDYMAQLETDENGEEKIAGWKYNGEHVARSRLRVESRKWLMMKLKPKKYGEKTHTEHSGQVNYSELSEEQLDAHLKSLLGAIQEES